jgi:hypothetical protein
LIGSYGSKNGQIGQFLAARKSAKQAAPIWAAYTAALFPSAAALSNDSENNRSTLGFYRFRCTPRPFVAWRIGTDTT